MKHEFSVDCHSVSIGCRKGFTISQWEQNGLQWAKDDNLSDADIKTYQALIEAAAGRKLDWKPAKVAEVAKWSVTYDTGRIFYLSEGEPPTFNASSGGGWDAGAGSHFINHDYDSPSGQAVKIERIN